MMELRVLRYFVAVAEELHFGRAAERLGIAQPPLSQQIRRLETELGVSLFARTKRHVELTEPGRVFLESARKVLAQAEQAVNELHRAARGEAGRLAVGLVSSATDADVIPRALRLFRERYPDVELALQEHTTVEQVKALREGSIHLGFVRPPIEDPNIVLQTIVKEPLLAVLPQGHPLAGQTAVELRSLAGEPFVMVPRTLGLGFYDLVLGACQEAGFTPRVVQEATQLHTMVGLVAAGIGVTMAPLSVRNLRRKGVVYVALAAPAPTAEIAAAYREPVTAPALAAFLDVLRHTRNRSKE